MSNKFSIKTFFSNLLAKLPVSQAKDSLPHILAVDGFDAARYTGNWYEIARLDNFFERGLTCASATYCIQPDGSIKVINRGFDPLKKKWKEACGRAVFIGEKNRGLLKVSFFGPFYGVYKIVNLDKKAYRWSLVIGGNTQYLWILSKDKNIPSEVKESLVKEASELGFNTSALIWTDSSSCPKK